ncbi:P1 family peptidase [Corynebacterium renale]|uniref:L-aminopeptidase/D-esterase-like protein n=1 Tax=Corynebacterium renale TaxID=1724 RepID=A0A2A9DNZ9_9CORY|nr:P1 family peptidase [Corynebacterium renale]PFG28111.1 L-aminopeptidase/D-esterase-like protein [Corynebacterium renale]SQI20518.1 L-aminopeptidase/D-esterase [Corynebacterium renale]
MPGLLTDCPGIAVGHWSGTSTGVTVVRPTSPDGALAAVDVRGGGPGTRETDLLRPENTVTHVHAVTLCGGSAFGLAAADGVMRELADRGHGFPAAPGITVPIVPAAVIFDLLVGQETPSQADGARALKNSFTAATNAPTHTSVGAGVGATAGKIRGGFGQASTCVGTEAGEYVIAAGIVANPQGSVVDKQGRLWADPTQCVDPESYAALPEHPGLNTTIGVIATNAPLDPGQAGRIAMVGHDGLARAIRPAHSPMDGDTLFSLSTADTHEGLDTVSLTALCAAAADVVEEAIAAAVLGAQPGLGLTTFNQLRPQKTKA